MGCNCGKTPPAGSKTPKQGGATQEFRLELPTGEALVYGSRLEADAARIRLGRVGTVRRAG